MVDSVDEKPRRKVTATPKGFGSVAEFLSDMRTAFDRAVGADEHNRVAALEDVEFTYGEQWEPRVRKSRTAKRKPVLTVNRLPAFVAQVVGNRLLNETEIRVMPDKTGTKEIAEVRQGIIKSIFKNSESDFARDEAMKYQVVAGLGAFHLCLEYSSDDVFEQDIKIKAIPDPLAAVFDEMSVEPSGGDATRGWVVDDIPNDAFKKRYPWASLTDFSTDFGEYRGATTWYGTECVKIVSYWRMVEDGTRILVLMEGGTTQEVDTEEELQDLLAINPEVEALVAASGGEARLAVQRRANGEPYVRRVPRRLARMYLCSGADILEGPYDLPISTIPIFRVPGWEMRNGNRVYRWGLVRFLKDPQRLHNYQRSLLAEQMVAAPRNKWIATKEAVAGNEQAWRQSHLDDDPLLLYNSDGQKPERIAPPIMDAALLTEAQMSVQDFRDVSNIHEAALGQKSNEVSAKAINARQAITDLGTFIYQDRLRMAEERCAKVINELIPTVYDTQRIITIMGEDNKAVQGVINDPSRPETDITLGKYGVSVTTGPATITKRALAAEQMMAFVNAVPESAAMVMDLIAEAQDWPRAPEFMRRFQASLPPGSVAQDDLPPEVQQMQAQNQEMQQAAAELAARKEEAEIAVLEAKAQESMARAQNYLATGEKALSDAEARQADVEGKNQQRDFDARLKLVETAIGVDEDADGTGSDSSG